MWSHEEWRDNLRREITEAHDTSRNLADSHADPRKAHGAAEFTRALAWVLGRMDDADRAGPGVGP
jgi:hypothetical protein